MGQPEAIPARSVPVWQKGTPQSMQRAPCLRRPSSGRWWWNSFQSLVRSKGAASAGSSRGTSMKPLDLATPMGLGWAPLGEAGALALVLDMSVPPHPGEVFGVLLEGGHDGRVAGQPRVVGPLDAGQHAL